MTRGRATSRRLQNGRPRDGRGVRRRGRRESSRLLSEYWARGSIEQLADRLLATGLVTAADVQRYLTLAADPAFLYPTPILVSAWGQRPAE